MEAVREHWLEQLYTDHYEGVFRFVCSILRDTSEAEDVVQDTFLKAYAAYGTYFSCGKERAWLFQIARRTAYDHLRRQSRIVPYEGDLGGASPSPAGETEWLDLLDRLPPVDRDIVRLHIVAGLTHQETARVLGRTVHGVKKRYERAIRALREQFEEGSS